jgi:hypothetical protein
LKACKALKKGDHSLGTEEEVAKRFGLVKFKSASEPYSIKGYFKAPRFQVDDVYSFARVLPDAPSRRPRALKPGEVAFIFDLNSALWSDKALTKKFANAEKIALSRMVALQAALGIEKLPSRRAHKKNLLLLVRLLDGRAAGLTWKEVFELIVPQESRVERASGSDWKDDFKKLRKQALALAKEDYRKLVLA